jgi:hypothetical protein
MTFGAIITWILWRFRPALWLDGVVARLIAWALRLLEDEDHREWLKENPAHCAWFGGWLDLGEARLDELIHYRACELLNIACTGDKPPGFLPARSVRTLDQAIGRFARLAERYSAIERLAQLRASKLRKMLEDADPWATPISSRRHPPPPPSAAAIRRRYCCCWRRLRFLAQPVFRPSPSAPRLTDQRPTTGLTNPPTASARTRGRA